jgi:hypothetical protein
MPRKQDTRKPNSKSVPTEKPAAAPPAARELAPAQQLIADEVADMLANGGDSRITDLLISAVAHHQRWRWAVGLYGTQDRNQVKLAVDDIGGRDVQELKADLIVAWRENHRAPKSARLEPKTVTERIRARVLDELRGRFEEFMTRGTPEECLLLSEILLNHESCTRGRDAFDELALGQAFACAIGKVSPDWVMVPESIRTQVKAYIQCLKAAEDRRSAA